MKTSKKKFRGAGGHSLVSRGSTEETLQFNGKKSIQTVYVIEGLVEPLLGKPAIESLRVLESLASIIPESKNWFKLFPELFKGLGCMEHKLQLKIKEGIEPYALAIPRRVAAARKSLLKVELERMIQLGVIEKVEKPTKWCSPCLVVPKKQPNEIRVCIDYTKLNAAVEREYFPLPSIEETLAQLPNAKYFS